MKNDKMDGMMNKVKKVMKKEGEMISEIAEDMKDAVDKIKRNMK
ncbi:hypothetical protein SAMN04487886_110110 [Clostridium sp. DSM 8431]|nr:hypothetical protein [Clostridium sp. DSM 8431]SFU68430.1 hypothetical protein SAMN04487886_110110 [Clostridium sp. DSM 8431]